MRRLLCLVLGIFLLSVPTFTYARTPIPFVSRTKHSFDSLYFQTWSTPVLKPAGCAETNAFTGQSCSQAFCANPVPTLCGSNGEVAKARSRSIRSLRSDLSSLAIVQAAKDLNLAQADDFTMAKFQMLENEDPHLWNILTARFMTRLRQSIDQKLQPAYVKTRALFEVVRKDLSEVVAEEFAADSILEGKAQRILSRVKVRAIDSFMKREDGEPVTKAFQAAIDDFEENCGADGLEDNAYQDSEGRQPLIVICPGFLWATLSQQNKNLPAEDASVFGLIMTMGHEMSHHFDTDNRAFKNAYGPLIDCLDSKCSDQLTGPIKKYKNEIIADYFGMSTLSKYLKREKLTSKAWDAAQVFSILNRNLEDICDDVDDGVHPSGTFRITNLARLHAALAPVLECKDENQNESKMCSLNSTAR